MDKCKCIAQITSFNASKASLQPLQRYNEQSNEWSLITTNDVAEHFPPNGHIFYPRKNQDVDIDHYSYVQCEYHENPIPPRDTGYDKMLAIQYTPLRLVYYPCFEQSDEHPFEAICASLLHIENSIKHENIESKEIYINIEKDIYIKAAIDSSVLRIVSAPNNEKCVPTYILDSASFFDIEDFSYTSYSSSPNSKTCYILCNSDDEFIRFVAKKMTKKIDVQYSKTKKEIEEIRNALLLLQPDDAEMASYDVGQILAHLGYILQNCVRTKEFITYADELIRSSDAFKARCATLQHDEEEKLRSATEKQLQEIETQQRRVMDEALQQERDELEQLRQTIANLSAEHEALREQLQNKRADREILHTALTEEKERICTMFAAVSEGEMPYARAFAARIEGIAGVSICSNALPEAIAPWAHPEVRHSCRLIQESELEQRLKEEKLPPVAEESLFWLDGLLRAGEPVWLLGLGREWLLTRYAFCVAGGHIYRMQADPSTLNIDDLWRLPGTREATALARAWAAATAMPNTTHIVALHVAGSPCHLWFPALGQALRHMKRPTNLLLALLPDNLPCQDESIDAFLRVSEAVFCPSVNSSGEYAFSILTNKLSQPTMLAMDMSKNSESIRDSCLLSYSDPWQTRRSIALMLHFLNLSVVHSWPLEAEQIDLIRQGRKELREHTDRN